MNCQNIMVMFNILEKYLVGNMYIKNSRYEELKNMLKSSAKISLLDQQDIYNIIQDGRFYFNSRIDRVHLDLEEAEISKIKINFGNEFLNDHTQYTNCYIKFLSEDYSKQLKDPENRFPLSGPLPDWAYYEKPLQRDLGSLLNFLFSKN